MLLLFAVVVVVVMAVATGLQLKVERKARAEAERAQRERDGMQAAEWAQERIKWRSGTSTAWTVVRVFISSTFTDMHGERDALTRNVFPLLNERARARRVLVLPVDLRWGLTSEDTSDSGLGALEHCLLEVEQTRPFFIVLGGERYGWVPPEYRVSDNPIFNWVRSFEKGHSITAMEVYQGFLRKPYAPVHGTTYHHHHCCNNCRIERPSCLWH